MGISALSSTKPRALLGQGLKGLTKVTTAMALPVLMGTGEVPGKKAEAPTTDKTQTRVVQTAPANAPSAPQLAMLNGKKPEPKVSIGDAIGKKLAAPPKKYGGKGADPRNIEIISSSPLLKTTIEASTTPTYKTYSPDMTAEEILENYKDAHFAGKDVNQALERGIGWIGSWARGVDAGRAKERKLEQLEREVAKALEKSKKLAGRPINWGVFERNSDGSINEDALLQELGVK